MPRLTLGAWLFIIALDVALVACIWWLVEAIA